MTRARTGGPRALLVVAVVLVLAGALALGGYAAGLASRSPAGRVVTAAPSGAPAAATVLPSPGPTGGSSDPAPRPAELARRLAPLLRAPALGARVRASVVDVATGATLLDRGGQVPAAPASTAKLLTAAALLTVRASTTRITTTVVAGRDGTIVLVGGGDPTLSGAAAGRPTPYAGAARLTDLAAQLNRAHVRVTRILVDDGLFTGPTVSPAWAAEDVPSSYASAITAVLTDGGRATPTAVVRSAEPDLAAGHELAAALGRPALTVTRGRSASGARVLATVRSAPLSVLVQQMLETSDNVLADCLARQVAIAEQQPASFVGAATAIRGVLRAHGDDPGAGMRDGSGLAAADRLAPDALTAVLRAVAAPSAGALPEVLAGLPVAGWSGTLADRFATSSSRPAAGLVRAKTGTLTGVSALAGVVHDRSGRLLALAVVADRVPSTPQAEAALDALAAAVASCGCA